MKKIWLRLKYYFTWADRNKNQSKSKTEINKTEIKNTESNNWGYTESNNWGYGYTESNNWGYGYHTHRELSQHIDSPPSLTPSLTSPTQNIFSNTVQGFETIDRLSGSAAYYQGLTIQLQKEKNEMIKINNDLKTELLQTNFEYSKLKEETEFLKEQLLRSASNAITDLEV